MDKMKDELLEEVSGGWNVDDLSPEDLEEFEKWGGILVEMQMKNKTGEAKYSKEEMLAVDNKIRELDKTFKEKYG